MTNWAKLTVVDLRAELKKRSLPYAGKKAELVSRLEEDDSAQPNDTEDHDAEPATTIAPVAPESTDPKSEDTHPEAISDEKGEDTLEPAGLVDDSAQPIRTDALAEPEPEAEARTAPDEPESIEPKAEDARTEVADEEKGVDTQLEVNNEVQEPTPVPSEVVKDVQSRKRRSRSPTVLSEEISRKRARTDDATDGADDIEMVQDAPADAANDFAPRSTTPAKDVPTSTMSHEEIQPMEDHLGSSGQDIEPSWREAGTTANVADDAMQDDEAEVAPALHPATSALYIKNFMRPLRDNAVKEHLVKLATPLNAPTNPEVVTTFYLDQIRTHAFVQFSSIAAASRVRVALHQTVWPDERNRKQLWVDFVPPEKITRWIEEEEQAGGGKRSDLKRWEVCYEQDEGMTHATLMEVCASDQPAQRPAPAPPVEANAQVPPGPSRTYPGIEAAPKGPRGGGGNYPLNHDSAGLRTQARPSIFYKPVAPELAEARLAAMRSFYTQDKFRDMGAEDEINRYTFESGASFVDRGKEVFIGIRPPHREHERRRDPRREHRGGARGGFRDDRRGDPREEPRGPPPPSNDRWGGPKERYGVPNGRYGGPSDREPPRRDVPRSRFTGEPLPSYEDRFDRRGGGGGRGGRFRSDYF